VGDAIVVTGIHGASRAGLELLLKPEFGENLSANERSLLIQAHQRPKPRLDVLPDSLGNYRLPIPHLLPP
jgi:thiamine-monophosphate kinase